LPAVQSAREAGRRVACVNNAKQLALAMQNYHSANQMLPVNYADGIGVGATCRCWSWICGILPYVEQQAVFDQIQVGQPIDPSNTSISRTSLSILICPSDGGNRTGLMNNPCDSVSPPRGSTNYKACAGSNWGCGAFYGISSHTGRWAGNTNGLDRGNGITCRNIDANLGNWTRIEDVTDGASNTFAVGEAVPAWCNWSWWFSYNGVTATCGVPLNYQKGTTNLADPANSGYWPNNYSFFSQHPGGANFGMVDGSVRFINDSVDTLTYRVMATISGGEVVQLP